MPFTKRLAIGREITWAEHDANLSEIEYMWSQMVALSGNALAATNFVGEWFTLSGALAIPAATYSAGKFWMLLSNVADVTAHTPGVSAVWVELKVADVIGPSSSVNNELALFSGTSGKLLKGGSGLTLASGILSGLLGISGLLSLNEGNIGGQRSVVLNGSFEHAQRGTSFPVTTAGVNVFTVDRWGASQQTAAAFTVSRQDSSQAAGRYALRVQRNAASAGTGTITLAQAFERASCQRLRGRKITLSFVARCGANFSGAANNLILRLRGNTSTTETTTANVHTGGVWTNSNLLAITGVTLTTTATLFTAELTLPSNIQQLGVLFGWTPTGTAGADDWFEVEDVKIELGAYTPYAIQDPFYDWVQCLRHCYRIDTASQGSAPYPGHVQMLTTTAARHVVGFPVPMRDRPVALEQSGTAANWQITHGGTNTALSAVPTYQNATRFAAASDLAVASGLTVGQVGYLRSASTTNTYLGWSADL